MADLTCTPSALMAETPCLQCLSKSQLMMVLLMVLAELEDYILPDDTAELFEDAKCFTCLSDTQLLQAVVTIIAQYLDTATVEELKAKMKCLQCANPQQIKGALTFLWCQLFAGVRQ